MVKFFNCLLIFKMYLFFMFEEGEWLRITQYLAHYEDREGGIRRDFIQKYLLVENKS